MNILSAEQIREWDRYTIGHEPISSIDLMERAAGKCVEWITMHYSQERSFKIFCGKGNNGGDGLSIARQLMLLQYKVSVFIPDGEKKTSEDFQVNLNKLQQLTSEIFLIESRDHLPLLNTNDLIIDALFGTGLNKPLDGIQADLVKHINHSEALVISIDMPSGMFADKTSIGYPMIRAEHTLSFQCFKKALLLQENGDFTGMVHVLDIGLDPQFISQTPVKNFFVVDRMVKTIYRPRKRFSHKGAFGHALLLAGGYGKMGAAVLAAKGCVHSGAGLVTCHIPRCGYEIMQASVPESMVLTDENEFELTQLPAGIEKYSAIGLGPGIGTSDATQKLLAFIIKRYQKPLVADADALNCLANQKDLVGQLPANSVLTPHPKEFDRLFGEHHSDFNRIEKALSISHEHDIFIVLKSHHTIITTPKGNCFFNSTGNAGMAKGGSGDVLTGIISSLLCQQYTPEQAAILGVYLHGLAGDFAADKFSRESMTPSHMITCLSDAFLQFR